MPHSQLSELTDLVRLQAPQNGLFEIPNSPVLVFRESQKQERHPVVYEPALVVACEGRKNVYLDGRRYDYGAGQGLALFAPMAVECELTEVPLLGFALRLDRHRLASLVLKMERAAGPQDKSKASSSSGIVAFPLSAPLLDSCIRLFSALSQPMDAAILGEALVDEVYYRLLSEQSSGNLIESLRQRGPVQQIGQAVDYLHNNLDKNIQVVELANLVCMSVSGFHKKFKDVMHVSPVQYVKAIRLNKAQTYLAEGRPVGEVGSLVGYNSPAQFSREYKRQFGFSPSVTPSL